MLCLLCLSLCLLLLTCSSAAAAASSSTTPSSSTSSSSFLPPSLPFLLPKFPPEAESCHLIAFLDDSYESKEADENLKKLEKKLNTKVLRLYPSVAPETKSLLAETGFSECGQLPFFFNRKTTSAVCGQSTYFNLLLWGTGDTHVEFRDTTAAQELEVAVMETQFEAHAARRVGFRGLIQAAVDRRVKKVTRAVKKKLEEQEKKLLQQQKQQQKKGPQQQQQKKK